MSDILIAVIIVYSMVIGGLCAWLAGEKGYRTVGWVALGFFLNIFALITIAGAPKK